MKDKHERNINYLRISVTDRCNLRCQYCMPKEGISKKLHNEMLSLEEIYKVVEACARIGINKVRITGGEPLVRRGLTDLIKNIAQISTIKDIALTTNGILLAKYAEELKNAGLNRVNISLDTLKEDKYKEITRCGELKDVLAGIKAAQECALTPIKLNTVLIGGFNDDELEDFVKLTIDNEIDIRFIELMPIGQASNWTKNHFVSNRVVLEQFKELEAVAAEDKSSPASYYKLPGAKGRIGLINPVSHSFCNACNRIRLTADGKLKPCLHSNNEIDIKSALRNNEADIKHIIEKAILLKPSQHNLNAENYKPIDRDMYRIGG